MSLSINKKFKPMSHKIKKPKLNNKAKFKNFSLENGRNKLRKYVAIM